MSMPRDCAGCKWWQSHRRPVAPSSSAKAEYPVLGDLGVQPERRV